MVDVVLVEIEWLFGRYFYFLDDYFFGNWWFVLVLFDGMKGMGWLW